MVNYCPVCKREYKESGASRTGRCPVCGSTLELISDRDINSVREENAKKK